MKLKTLPPEMNSGGLKLSVVEFLDLGHKLKYSKIFLTKIFCYCIKINKGGITKIGIVLTLYFAEGLQDKH